MWRNVHPILPRSAVLVLFYHKLLTGNFQAVFKTQYYHELKMGKYELEYMIFTEIK